MALVIAATVLINASPSSADPSLDADEQDFLMLINNYRAQNGLNVLVTQDDLAQAADWYATDMTSKNYYGGDAYCAALDPPKPAHCDSLGRGPGERLVAFGYPTHQLISENIAAGFSTAKAVFDAWASSSGHNANMLGGSWTAIGIGKSCSSSAYYGCYWVTDFGTYSGPDNPNPSATAAPSSTQQPTPPPTIAPTPTPAPTPTNRIWDDVDCDGHVTPADAMAVLRGDAGFSPQGVGCPSVGALVGVNGAYRVWGDTDCSLGVQVQDSVKLLAYLAGVVFDVPDTCPAPGTHF